MGFLLPVVYLGAHTGSEVGLGSDKLGIPLERVHQSRMLEAGEAGSLYLGDLVKLAEELIEHEHQLLWGALTGQPCEAHDVSIQHAG